MRNCSSTEERPEPTTATAPANSRRTEPAARTAESKVASAAPIRQAARQVGVDVPYYCYHPKLSISGNCRMCLVEIGMPAVDPATKAPIMDPATG
ncbi:MAG: 2Fe-2S iron-sulfur cluster-binding protein, partial [Opitutaceae bacterium]